MGDVLKNLKHSGDGSPLVHLGSRSCRLRQKHLRGLEHKHTDLGGLHLQSALSAATQGCSILFTSFKQVNKTLAICTDVTLDLLDAMGELHSTCGMLYTT